MPTVLICMLPEAGHTIPAIKVARDLTQRGHKVIFLTCGKIRQELAELGFDARTVFFESWPELAECSLFKPVRPGLMYRSIAERLTHNLPVAFDAEVRALAIGVDADLVLLDGVCRGAIRRVHTDRFALATLHVHLPYVFDQPPTADPVIYLSPIEFELPQLVSDRAHYTEPSLFFSSNRESQGENALLSNCAGGKIVYCSLGSRMAQYPRASSFFQSMLDLVRHASRYYFILNVGSWANELVTSGNIPDNVKITASVRHSYVLPKSDVAIIHGGFGILKECIYHGVPMIVYPQMWDQPMNAVRVEAHGLGLNWTDRSLQVSDLLSALNWIVDSEEVKERIGALQSIFRASQIQPRTAELCETIISRA